MARPATGQTRLRNFRISDAVYNAAMAAANERGETLTSVVERALRRYVAAHERARRT